MSVKARKGTRETHSITDIGKCQKSPVQVSEHAPSSGDRTREILEQHELKIDNAIFRTTGGLLSAPSVESCVFIWIPSGPKSKLVQQI